MPRQEPPRGRKTPVGAWPDGASMFHEDVGEVLMPVTSSGGDPACPMCGHGLRYVRRLIVRAEHEILSTEIDDSLPEEPFVMLTVAEEPGREDIVEYLEAFVWCASLECGYRVPGERAGEPEWVSSAADDSGRS